MSYSLTWHPKALKFLEALTKEVSKRVLEKFDELQNYPIRYVEHYEGEYYKLRIGDYRALLEINFEQKIIKVRYLDKRGRIYKK